jgi:hypothetical protein
MRGLGRRRISGGPRGGGPRSGTAAAPVGSTRKGVDLSEKRIFCIIKQGKKTREVTSPGPWPLIFIIAKA